MMFVVMTCRLGLLRLIVALVDRYGKIRCRHIAHRRRLPVPRFQTISSEQHPRFFMARTLTHLRLISFALLVFLVVPYATAAEQWAHFAGGEGPGKGKRVVLISG